MPDRKRPPAGERRISLEELPPPDVDHWVAKRKAQVVRAVQSGLLGLDEALSRYRLSLEEYSGWQKALYRHGLQGLQISHAHMIRLNDRLRRRPGRRAARKEAKSA